MGMGGCFKLSELLNFLDSLDAADFRTADIDRELSSRYIGPEGFAPYTHFREEGYARNLVTKNPHYELVVLTWLPGQSTPIHNHDGQRCWMVILQGTLRFHNYLPIHIGDPQPRVAGESKSRSSGQRVYIDDGIGAHAIANESAEPAVSIHLYAAPIEQCLIYCASKKKFETRVLSYFTMPEPAPNVAAIPKDAFPLGGP